MHLTLIRHARSNHIQSGMISGVKSCKGLSTEGVTQAERLADRLRTTGEFLDCRTLLSSPVRRAWQTAEIIAEALPGVVPMVEPDLVELRPGDSDGLYLDEFKQRYGDFNPMEEPDRPFPPNGETWECFMDRVNHTLHRIATQYAGQNVVAVTHAGFIVAAFIILFQLPSSGNKAWIDPQNTSITEWGYDKDRWELLKYNDTWHIPDASRQRWVGDGSDDQKIPIRSGSARN